MVYQPTMSNTLLIMLSVLYIIITDIIVYKHRTLYKRSELELSKILLIALIFGTTVSTVMAILVFPNVIITNILIAISIGALIHINHVIICLK